MLKAVLFDMDQTIVDWDTVEPWEDYQLRRMTGVLEYVKRAVYPLNGLTAQDFFKIYIRELTAAWKKGNLTLEAPRLAATLVATLVACGVPEDKIGLDDLIDAYDWRAPEGMRAYPDALSALPQLRARGIDLGLVTNSSYPMTLRDRELRTTGLLDFFPRCRLSAADVGYLKPHRSIFERALELLGAQPEEAVFVGDNLTADVYGAQNIGMRGVWRQHTANEADDETQIVPDGTINTIHDLFPLLDEWYPDWRS
jgi:putative hydrolase of the HAD superfamily